MPSKPQLSTGYHCPYCGEHKTEVIDSRSRDGRIYRRRKCGSCESRFATLEIPVNQIDSIDLRSQAAIVSTAMNDMIQKFNIMRKQIRDAAKRSTG